MNDCIEIRPAGRVDATVVLPGSKSETIRALICAALADGKSEIRNALFCEDTLAVADSLARLGIGIEAQRSKNLFEIEGCCGRIPDAGAELDLKSCATGMRFLASVAALGKGRYRFDGSADLRARPLLTPVEEFAEISYQDKIGYLPFIITGGGIGGMDVSVDCSRSSQPAGAVLLIAPVLESGAKIKNTGNIASSPYINLTLKVMSAFGAKVERSKSGFAVSGGGYGARSYEVEGDAGAAIYFLAAAAVTRGRVRAISLGRDSVQADAMFPEILAKMGCEVMWGDNSVTVVGPEKLRALDADFFSMPDSAPTFALLAAFADGPCVMSGLQNLCLKESDRIDSIVYNLNALGIETRHGEDFIEIFPGEVHGGGIDTRGDHRIAMSFALAGLIVPGVVISNPGCVEKSLPEYFSYLDMLTD